jgi:L-ribulose-5-phosphate 4-epimerase
MSFEKEKQDLIDTARKMEKYQLIRMSGGNVSLRIGDDLILVTPTAMDYDTMLPEDIVAVDLKGNIV